MISPLRLLVQQDMGNNSTSNSITGAVRMERSGMPCAAVLGHPCQLVGLRGGKGVSASMDSSQRTKVPYLLQ